MSKKALSCKYNQECWMKHRLPLIRKYKIYLPYECSFVAMGDMENCTLRDGFIERERLKGVKELNDDLPTAAGITK